MLYPRIRRLKPTASRVYVKAKVKDEVEDEVLP